MPKKTNLKVFRYDPATKKTRYDIYELEPKSGMTVLNALFSVQDHFDDSLSFRYSCRGAVCGTCAMLINRIPRLACRTLINNLINSGEQHSIIIDPTQVSNQAAKWNPETEILIEPLPNLKVIKDLVVDMEIFFKKYRSIKPILESKDGLNEKEHLMDPEVVTDLENFTNCVLCAACFSACPINKEKPDYLGPAALAKLYRFYIDTRIKDNAEKLKLANNATGWWACKFHLNCKNVCPKGVQPNLAIGQARRKLKELGLVDELNNK